MYDQLRLCLIAFYENICKLLIQQLGVFIINSIRCLFPLFPHLYSTIMYYVGDQNDLNVYSESKI